MGRDHSRRDLVFGGSARVADHEAVIRFGGEAPRWRAHSVDGVTARLEFGFTITSDQCRQPVASLAGRPASKGTFFWGLAAGFLRSPIAA